MYWLRSSVIQGYRRTAADLDYFTIGVIHNLSKKTRLTAGFRSYDTSATAETDTFAVGMRMKF